MLFLLGQSQRREKYNIVGEQEVDNLSLAETIASILGKKLHFELVDFHGSRPGHDLRYALDGDRLLSMGWKHPKMFVDSLRKTVEWTVRPENARWLKVGV